jgi:BlaI family transcriptional regulator, penicillinase repressor
MPRKPAPGRAEPPRLSRRERQIMDILYARGAASVAEVLASLPDPPSYSAVRALLAILETKGHARHRDEAGKYVYLPVTPRTQAAKSALERVLETFFAGRLENALAAHLQDPSTKLSPETIERLTRLIQQAKERQP